MLKDVPVSAKGQVVIPKEIREKLGLKPGDSVNFVQYAGAVILLKALKDPIAEGYGMLAGGPSLTEALLRDRQEELEREEREIREWASKGSPIASEGDTKKGAA